MDGNKPFILFENPANITISSRVKVQAQDYFSFAAIPVATVHIPVSCFTLQQDKWHPLLTTVANAQKYRWLKHSVQGIFSQSSLMATIVEFALKEEPLDVEKMRKCLLKQVIVNHGLL